MGLESTVKVGRRKRKSRLDRLVLLQQQVTKLRGKHLAGLVEERLDESREVAVLLRQRAGVWERKHQTKLISLRKEKAIREREKKIAVLGAQVVALRNEGLQLEEQITLIDSRINQVRMQLQLDMERELTDHSGLTLTHPAVARTA